MRVTKLSTCNLNQWAMDFAGNVIRIKKSIDLARACGSAYRVGPELEIPGYSCEDHFFEMDTYLHSWEALAALLVEGFSDDILIDVGMPVMHQSACFNCRVICLNKKIVLIRPKQFLADDGNYRESRWFRPWPATRTVETYQLPPQISNITEQKTCPIGEAIIRTVDASLAAETCEELFTLDAPHIKYILNGVDIISNGSGSHHNLRKLNKRVELLRSATSKGGGVYMYANQIGCDGNRLYFDGSAMIMQNGQVLSQGHQFYINEEVEVISAIVDLDEVQRYRCSIASTGYQASQFERLYSVSVDYYLCKNSPETLVFDITQPTEIKYHSVEEEIALGPACWLWDYLRRSGMNGYFLPLSGGADSSSTAAIVGSMCQLVVQACQEGHEIVIKSARKLAGLPPDSDYIPSSASEFANLFFHTSYMGYSNHSSSDTRNRSQHLAQEIGAYHVAIDIGLAFDAIVKIFSFATSGKEPRFKVYGGSHQENLALQNIQARIRMVLAYLFAQLSLWARGRPGSLLVLGSANVDEGLRGYLTKYDCSSADVNPIGGISKSDLKLFLRWASQPRNSGMIYGMGGLGYPSLREVVEAPPTAELEPITESYTQTDEVDMGMTYDELTVYGRLRKLYHCGPVSMFQKLVGIWKHLPPTEIATKVKFFFRMYSINRHKMTTLTPSYHAENYSPEDNRFDLRQFLYNVTWNWQFSKIDDMVTKGSQNKENVD